MKLQKEYREVRLGDIRPQQLNARFMRKETFDRLVKNIRRDGTLTSAPLLHEVRNVLWNISGHHRVEAAIEALGADHVDTCIVITQKLSRPQVLALQMSHNSLSGEDDPATLRQMWDELDDVDWKDYAGLDDKTLGLMDDVDIDSLSEANLEFMAVNLSFLPAELDHAEAALAEARKTFLADKRWVAPYPEYERTLDALQSAHVAWNVGNVATALMVVIEVFERHLTDLADGWYDDADQVATRGGQAPIESVFGTRTMPTEAAAVVKQAMDRALRNGDVQPDSPWRFLELMAAEYLAGAD